MTTVQRAAQIFGWAFIIIAVWGFFVSGGSMVADPELAPRILGLFPVNLVHNLVHLASGVIALIAARSWDSARTYCRVFGIIYLALVPLGFLLPELLGLMPLGSHDIWLHALLGIGLVYFGFTAREPVERPAA